MTIAGSGFGASQSSGNVWLASTYGNVVSWSDTQVVATVASGPATGSVRIQQGGVWSNTGHFVVPTVGSGNAETIVPNVLSLLVGQTRTIQALNSSGAEVSGLAWASSDTTVVSLSTDDPPILTAVAPGHVSIAAGDASADVTVYSGYALPTGTVIWSAPGDGTGVSRILPAVPSSTGVADVFALQSSGNVQAITTDGSVAWTASVGTGNTLLPDFQGGLVVANYASIKKLDGITGQITSQYNYVGAPQSNVAIHTNGTIFAVDGSSLVGIDPATGSPIFTIPLDQSTSDQSNACEHQPDTQSSSPPQTGPLIIAGDGNAYLIYQYTEYSTTEQLQSNGVCDTASFDQLHLRLLQVDPSGNAQKIVIQDWNAAYGVDTELVGGRFYDTWTQNGQLPQLYNGSLNIVTNADSGVLLALQYGLSGYCSLEEAGHPIVQTGCVPATYQRYLMAISGGGVVSNTLLTVGDPEYGVVPILQAQNGTYFGVGLSSTTSMDAFDQNGNVMWSVPNFTPVIATADGGVIAQSATGQYMTFDQNGVADGMLASMPTLSWIGAAYQSQPTATQFSYLLPSDYAQSYAALGAGNQSTNGTAIKENPYPRLKSCYNSANNTMCAYDALLAGLQALQAKVGGNCIGADRLNDCLNFVFNKLDPGAGVADQSKFSTFINRYPQFFDGTTCTLLATQTCELPDTTSEPWDAGLGCYASWVGNYGTGETIADFFASNPGLVALAYYQPTNAQSPTGKKGLIIFFKPSAVCTTYPTLDNGSCQTRNASNLFHEGLHEYYGIGDHLLQSDFGIQVRDDCTANISDYISYWVFDTLRHSCSEPETLGSGN